MSTAETYRPRRKHSHSKEERKKAPRRGFGVRVLIAIAILAGGLYFAPAIVSHTPLRDMILRSAVPLDGKITIGRSSLGWLSTIAVENLEIQDRQGTRVIHVAWLTSEKSLLSILLDRRDLGRLHLSRPEVNVVVGQKGTNLEEIFAPLIAAEEKAHLSADLDVTEGTVSLNDTVAGNQFKVEKLALDCKIADAIAVSASGEIDGKDERGSFHIDLLVKNSDDKSHPLASGKIDCQSTALPLELIEPLVRHKLAGARLSGTVTTQLNGAWGDLATAGDSSLRGEITVKQLDFSAPALKTDHIRLERLDIPCHLVQKGDWIEAEQLAIRCELGDVSLSGSAKTSDFLDGNRLAALVHGSCELRGQVDLARLVHMLPETLRLRQGTEVTAGELAFTAASHRHAGGTEWTGRIDAGALAARVNGRPITWDNPLAVEFAARETKDGVVLDQARCTSTFLRIDAEGSPNDWNASADFDLAKLVAELSRFSDLDDLKLAGHGQAHLVWKHTGSDLFYARSEFHARGLQWIVEGARPWTEEDLMMTAEISGNLHEKQVKRIDKAQLTVTAGSERAEAELRESVINPSTAPWSLDCTWSGELAHWATRLETCLGIPGWHLQGTGTAQATLLVSSKLLEIAVARADFTKFAASGNGWNIQEPAAQIELNGKIDPAANRVELVQAKASAGTIHASAKRLIVVRDANGVAVDMVARVSGELAELQRWQQDPRAPSTLKVSGKLSGEAQLKTQQGTTSGQFDGAIDNLEIVDHTPGASKPAAWKETQVTFLARGNYARAAERVQLDRLQVACEGLRCDTSGAVPVSAKGGPVQLKGTVEYDWAQLAPLWRSYVGDHLDVAGRQTRDISVQGNLSGALTSVDSWRGVTAEASIGWTSANVFGLSVGRGDIVSKLGDGQVRIQPLDIEINEGRLTLAPVVRLDAKPVDVVVSRGPFLTDIHLSRQQCAKGLKFIAPILSDSTTADGRFSVSLEGGRVPIGDPAAADIGGTMAMRAQAKPGPVAREFLVLIRELGTILQRGPFAKLDQDGAIVSIDDSSIEFRVVNRRVYHRNLSFKIGNMPISTYGSVGTDETLSIVAEVPIQAQLFGLDLSLGTLEGRVIKVPIGGTLSNPKLDPRALQQLTAQAVESAARSVIVDGVGKQLERLLPPKP
jgi:translocation and assembly module TamB